MNTLSSVSKKSGAKQILVGLVVYQNRVIVKQSVELRWMLAHCKQ